MVYLSEIQTSARYLQRKEEPLETKYARKGSAVYSALAATKLHPSADTLYRDLQKVYPNISRTTVYANLTKLREEGSVICVGVVDGRERYDANTRPHPHFICEQCGTVLDVKGLPEPPSLDRQAEVTNPIKVSYHELIFRGLCGECAGITQSTK
jgi:Fur family peroxide stress response transcriptional regulator